MATSTDNHSVSQHFTNRSPNVKAIYKEIVRAARTLGPVREEARKTSIHLVRKSAFAGVATRKTTLILTLKSVSDIRDGRIIKREQVSANRWHVEIRLAALEEVDEQLLLWLEKSFGLSG